MNFTVETKYDQKSFTVMARVLRKTIRKKQSNRSHIMGILLIIAGTFLCFANGFKLNTGLVTMLALALIAVVLLWEDQVNAYLGRKRMLSGLSKSVTTFTEESYCSETEIGKSEFAYDKVTLIAETEEYFVFVFDKLHGQVYDKRNIHGGSVEEFRSFLEERTKKKVEKLK